MSFAFIPQIIIGIILMIVGIRMNMDFPIANMIRLALILIGIVILGYGIFGITDQIAVAMKTTSILPDFLNLR